MDEQDPQLIDILRIGHDTSGRGAGLSLRDALSRIRYGERRAGFDEATLLRLVRAHPAFVEDWLAYSEDKRTSAGWYVLKNAQIGRVNVPESQIQFASIEEAIASYVIRELDFWANVSAG